MGKSLAIKYRPKTWDDVTEQQSIKLILSQQIESNDIKGAYCFVGAAGTGKTTCARIFANEINHGEGVPIEMDAASHNGVDDVREISKMAQTKALDAEYKVFILDEAHMFSAGAWAAMLKLIEEPPAKCVFILCTTDYWKIPKTIQSRCQRFQFHRISTEGIVSRLHHILYLDDVYDDSNELNATMPALEYIARLSDGCMREAIVTLEKCLAYSDDLSIENVTAALGLSNHDTFMCLTNCIYDKERHDIIEILEKEYETGTDMKQFVRDYLHFILDVNKLSLDDSLFSYTQLPRTDDMKDWLKSDTVRDIDFLNSLLGSLIELNSVIKWDSSPLYTVEAKLMML